MRGKAHLLVGSMATIELAIICGSPVTPAAVATAVFFSVAADLDEPNSNVMNHVVNKKTVANIHNIIMLGLCAMIFFVYYKTSKNFYISIAASVLTAVIIGKRFTSGILRRIMIFLFFMLIAVVALSLSLNTSSIVLLALVSLFPLLKHRSLTHSVFMLAIIGGVLYMVEIGVKVDGVLFCGVVSYITHIILDIITKRGVPLFYPISKKYHHIIGFRVGSFVSNIFEWILILFISSLLVVTLLYKL